MNYDREVLQHMADQDAARRAESRNRYHAEAAKRALPRYAPAFGRDPAVIIERARRGMSNPFSKESFNLTEAAVIQRDAPELAARLRALAEGAE